MDKQTQSLICNIGQLTASVHSFHERFGLIGPSTREELLSRIPIQSEEVQELHQALLHEPIANIAAEATDILYVAIGTLLRLDNGLATKAIQEVIDKNNAKTWDTHHINEAGKVTRRP